MTLLVKDEIDIIETNLKFHLEAGVDHVIVTDNGSSDGTRDLLSDYARLAEVSVIDEPEQDYSQHRWVTRMALMAAEQMRADWIINNDADEFWQHPELSLKQALIQAKAEQQVCQRRNLFYALDGDETQPWFERNIYYCEQCSRPPRLPDALKDALPSPFYTLNLLPKILLRAKNLEAVGQGNHSASYVGNSSRENSEIMVYHFPIRNSQQLQQKVLNGGAAYARNQQLPKNVGWHWRRFYHQLQNHGLSAMLADALPDRAWIEQGLKSGHVASDRSMVPALSRLGTVAD